MTQVDYLESLGYCFHDNSNHLKPVIDRLASAERAFWKLQVLLTEPSLSRYRRLHELRKRGCTMWSLSWAVLRLLMAFEKRCLRRIFPNVKRAGESFADYRKRHTQVVLEICHGAKHDFLVFAAMKRIHSYVGSVLQIGIDAPQSLQLVRSAMQHQTRLWWRTIEQLYAAGHREHGN